MIAYPPLSIYPVIVLPWHPDDKEESLSNAQSTGLRILFTFATHKVDLKGDVLRRLSETNWRRLHVDFDDVITHKHVEALIRRVSPTIVMLL